MQLDFCDKTYYILDLLKKGNSRLIGGCVRDKLLNYSTSDIDIASSLLPNESTELLEKNNVKVIPTGIKFGTITAIYQDQSFEITTLRKDLECDGRYAKSVVFTDSFYEDASRRDFTINALSYSVNENKLYDYFNGIEHANNRKVIFIGNAEDRIQEDYLRILRFLRFSGRYADTLDTKSFEACVKYKDNLLLLSKERITKEFSGIISTDKSSFILQEAQRSGILSIITPNVSIDLLSAVDLKAKSENIALDLETRYALLFDKNFDKTAYNILLSRKQKRKINAICKYLNLIPNSNIEELIKYYWISQQEINIDQFLIIAYTLDKIEKSDFYSLKKELFGQKPKFPVKGTDLMNMGYKDKEISFYLDFLMKKWINSNFAMSLNELIKCIL